MLDTWEGGWIFMLEGGWDSGSSCWPPGREAGIVDGGRGWDSGSCWTLGREAGIVGLHVGHMGGRLG